MNGMALCAGVGMLDEGVRAGFEWLTHGGGCEYRTVCYVEREAYAAAALVARMEDASLDRAPIWDDLKTFKGRNWSDVVDCITAGIPCQGNSMAGKRKLEADPRNLWPATRRILRDVGPEWFFLENVPGILVPGGPGEPAPICRILGELSEMRFDAEWCTVSAAEVGGNHKRERVFVLAHAQRFSSRQWPGRQRVQQGDTSMAQPQGGRCGSLRESSQGPRGQLDGSHEPLADAQDAHRRQHVTRAGANVGEPQPGCSAVAESSAARLSDAEQPEQPEQPSTARDRTGEGGALRLRLRCLVGGI